MKRWSLKTRVALAAAGLAVALPAARAAQSTDSPRWLVDLPLLRLVIYGSVAGLALSVLVLLLIWWNEWRRGDVW